MKRLMIFFLICLINYVKSQDWQWLTRWQALNTINQVLAGTNAISVYKDSILIVSGNFRDTLIYENDTLINPNNISGIKISSGYIYRINSSNAHLIWKKYIYGENLSIKKSVVFNDTIYILGDFFNKMVHGNDTLKTPTGPIRFNGIFIIKMSLNGNFINGKLIAYGYNCSAEDILVDNNEIFISGNFYESLFIPGYDTITNNYATSSLYILKLDNSLNTQWHRWGNFYYSDQNKNIKSNLSLINNKLFLSGHFSDSLKFDTSGIQIYSNGINGFISSFDIQTGLPIWALKMGDVNTRGTYYYDLQANNKFLYLTGYVTQPSFFNVPIYPDSLTRAFLMQVDTTGNIHKIWYPIKGKNSQGLSIGFDKSGNKYFTIAFDDTLIFLKDTFYFQRQNNVKYLAIFKITDDSIVRYIHTLQGGISYYADVSIDSYGNYYCGGRYIKNDVYADTSNFVQLARGNNFIGFAGKISCRASSPKIIFSDTSICYNEVSVLSSDSIPFYQALWSNEANQYTTSVNGGNYWLMVSDENGCVSDTSFIHITQFPRTHIKIYQQCDSLFIKDTLFVYQWLYQNNTISTNPYLNNVQNGWYIFTSEDINGCLIRDSILINIQNPSLSIQKLCDSLKTNVSSVWYLNAQPIDTSQSIYISQSGDYYVSYTDSVGCIWHSDTVSIEIDGKRTFQIYPNPVEQNLIIETNEDMIAERYSIFDVMGHLLITSNNIQPSGEYHKECNVLHKWNISIPSHSLKPGVYIMQLHFNNQQIITQKIIKQ